MDDSRSERSSMRKRDSRSRSPRRHQSHSHSYRKRSPHSKHHRSKGASDSTAPQSLPFNSPQLTKYDYEYYKPMFALYLDMQKSIFLDELGDAEYGLVGAWLTCVRNRGELSEGWYDPSTLRKAQDSTRATAEEYAQESNTKLSPEQAAETGRAFTNNTTGEGDDGSDSDDSIGPTLPGDVGKGKGSRMGPSIPNLQDLELKREMDEEDKLARRDDIRFARKLDRKEQKAALDELVPRAEAGTRERQLEKKKEVNEKMKSFREKSPGAAEVPDSDLMGGDDGIEGFKKKKEEFERKKNERELRREEIMRARQAEREERLQEYRQKEEGTMAMLKALAKQNFG
ncbi:hypothetical protein CJF31_00010385 [Rutstroemia sp. NJR-2017a BVV2]|nr:hypothetical protein CJF31_00010385 [Rutstroemia sp. NJR-2017a BVV2]